MRKRSDGSSKFKFWTTILFIVIASISGAMTATIATVYFPFALGPEDNGACIDGLGDLICFYVSGLIFSLVFALTFGLLWHYRFHYKPLIITTTVLVVLLIFSLVFVMSVNAQRTKFEREKVEANLKDTVGECGLAEDPGQWEDCISKYASDIKSSFSCKPQVSRLLFLPKPESYEICDKVFHGAIIESQIVQCNSLKEVQELKFCGYDVGYLVWPLETPEVCYKLVSSIARSACFYESLVIEEHFVEYMKDEELRRSVCSQLDKHDFESVWAKSKFDILCRFTNRPA